MNHCKPVTFARRAAAFTLIELMLVIAIIGMMVSLLLPSLQGARVEAWRTVCLGNERMIGMGFANYLHDYNNAYPYWDPAATPMGPGTYLSWPAATDFSWMMAIQPYMGQYKVGDTVPYFRCPSNPWKPFATNAQFAPACTYGMNAMTFPQSYGSTSGADPYTNPSAYIETRKVWQLKRPSATCIVADVPSAKAADVAWGQQFSDTNLNYFIFESPYQTTTYWPYPDIGRWVRMNHHIPNNYENEKIAWNAAMCDGSAKSFNKTIMLKYGTHTYGGVANSDGMRWWFNK